MKKTLEEIIKVFESKSSFRILLGLGIVLVTILIFSAGVSVGFHKASFGRAWGEHYNENFGMGHRDYRRERGGEEKIGMMGRLNGGMMDYFPNSHGAVGKIIKIELPNVIVQDKEDIEKIVLVDNETKIQKGRDAILATDLNIDDYIVTIGTPDNKGIIEAKLIRLIPSPEFFQ